MEGQAPGRWRRPRARAMLLTHHSSYCRRLEPPIAMHFCGRKAVRVNSLELPLKTDPPAQKSRFAGPKELPAEKETSSTAPEQGGPAEEAASQLDPSGAGRQGSPEQRLVCPDDSPQPGEAAYLPEPASKGLAVDTSTHTAQAGMPIASDDSALLNTDAGPGESRPPREAERPQETSTSTHTVPESSSTVGMPQLAVAPKEPVNNNAAHIEKPQPAVARKQPDVEKSAVQREKTPPAGASAQPAAAMGSGTVHDEKLLPARGAEQRGIEVAGDISHQPLGSACPLEAAPNPGMDSSSSSTVQKAEPQLVLNDVNPQVQPPLPPLERCSSPRSLPNSSNQTAAEEKLRVFESSGTPRLQPLPMLKKSSSPPVGMPKPGSQYLPGSPLLGAYYGVKVRQRSPGTASSSFTTATFSCSPARDESKAGRRFGGASFDYTSNRDLPAEYRKIVEDNRMLAEELRCMKHRAYESESKFAMAERQLSALRAENKRLQTELQACGVQPSQRSHEAHLQEQLAAQKGAAWALEERLAILEKARESAERKGRLEVQAERRLTEAAKAEAAMLKEALNDKDRQARMTALHMRTVYKRLDELEAAVRELPKQPQEDLVLLEAPPAPPAETVRLMLCIVCEQQGPTAAEVAEAERLAQVDAAYCKLQQQIKNKAALSIQTRFKGFKARKQLQKHIKAAVTIQAYVRAMLARRQEAAMAEASSNASKPSTADGRLKDRRSLAEQRHADRSKRRQGFVAAPAARPEDRLPRRPSAVQPASQGNQAQRRSSLTKTSTAPEAAFRQWQGQEKQPSRLSTAASERGTTPHLQGQRPIKGRAG